MLFICLLWEIWKRNKCEYENSRMPYLLNPGWSAKQTCMGQKGNTTCYKVQTYKHHKCNCKVAKPWHQYQPTEEKKTKHQYQPTVSSNQARKDKKGVSVGTLLKNRKYKNTGSVQSIKNMIRTQKHAY